MINILKMLNKKKNPENYERLFNILYTYNNKQSLLIKGQKNKEKKLRNKRANSLKDITKKFIQVLLEERETDINLKDIIKKIEVKKRRIYDITNVFQCK